MTATRNKHVHFSAKLHEVAANHNLGIGMGVQPAVASFTAILLEK